MINPYSVGEIADAVHRALTMPEEDRRKRMERLRAEVRKNNVYRWAGRILSTLLKFDFPEGTEEES